MSHRRQAGEATGSIVLLLLVVCGVGGWNYNRNLQLENAAQTTRPYEGYSVEDLGSLRDAYSSELESMRANFSSAKRQRARPVRDVGSIAGNVEQFQQTTRASTAIRAAAAGVSEREEQIELLKRELAFRTQFGEGIGRHVKRLITI